VPESTEQVVATTKKIPVETYSRVVGYFRPVNQWNKGKQAEYYDRNQLNSNVICGLLKDSTNKDQKMTA